MLTIYSNREFIEIFEIFEIWTTMYRRKIVEKALQLDRDGYSVTEINAFLHKEFHTDFKHKDTLADRTIYMWLKKASVIDEEQKHTTEDMALAKRRHFDDIAAIAKLLA
jgi:hypothetical protein